MSKSVKIQDSPEFKAFKENFEATMDAMEKDPEFAQMKLPEEWERDFKETMEATWEEERQRKKKRIGKRIAIAAGVTLVTLAGLNLGVQQVQGEGLVEFFQRTFHLDGKQYTILETNDIFEMHEEENIEDIFFEANTLEELNEKIREEIKTPMFYIGYIPEQYEISEVKYNPTYNIINYVFESGEKIIHFSQMQQYDEIASGDINEDKEHLEVNNKNINQKIYIYKSLQDESFTFNIVVDRIYLTVNCLDSIEECKKIAENIDYH